MLLVIDKYLMTIELSLNGRNPNITPQTRTPFQKKGENHFSTGLYENILGLSRMISKLWHYYLCHISRGRIED
jgi:hypothetical protein